MTNLVEFWLILERDLVESALHKIFDEYIWNYYTAYYRFSANQLILSHGIFIYYEEVMTFLPETPVLD